ncbi:hypothetical protein ACFLU5_05785 [Bacteroidota bacterium]
MGIRNIIGILIILFVNSTGYTQNADLPEINQEIVSYVKTVIGEKVGRGECWDLADAALTTNNAKFDKSSQKTLYIFGKEYNPKKDIVLPGDIIQFENVTVKYENGNTIFTESYGHHTAIVYNVLENNHIELAHQNTGFSGKKVGVSTFRFDDVQKGKMKFYHPIKK